MFYMQSGNFVTEDEAWLMLAIAVVNQAQFDYESAMMAYKKNPHDYISRDRAAEYERFFLSDFGQALSFGHGEGIVAQCKRHVAAGRVVKRSNTI